MNASTITSIQGMNDILPVDTKSSVASSQWEWLEGVVRDVMQRFSYQNIRTPLVEPTALFVRGVGEATDIVSKEMYTFPGSDGESFTLRPENTASVVRSAIQNNLLYDAPRRLYYMGSMFRRERPQKGRYRQFNQIGAEALGFSGSEMDVELILLASAIFSSLGLTANSDYRLEINSLGNAEERRMYKDALTSYLIQNKNDLDESDLPRIEINPLRLLDSKNKRTQSTLRDAPQLPSFLGEQSLSQLKQITRSLDLASVPYTLNPSLVRGLDYYTGAVFEFVTEKLGAQNAICGGGRYDGLFEQMGGSQTPAVGFAFGVERVLELLKSIGKTTPTPAPDVFVVVSDSALFPSLMGALQRLRMNGVSIQMQASQRDSDGYSVMPSFKAQFKKANVSGARYTIIFGDSEATSNTLTLKNMADGTQSTLPLADIDSILSALNEKVV
jgi:histidyl-tRNA synthetase